MCNLTTVWGNKDRCRGCLPSWLPLSARPLPFRPTLERETEALRDEMPPQKSYGAWWRRGRVPDMYVLKLVLLTIHITAAAIIFAAPLGTIGSLKRALAGAGDSALKTSAKDAAVRSQLAYLGAIVTLVTGVVLIFVSGGFGVVGPRFHAALTLMVVAIGFRLAFIKPNGKKLAAAAAASPADRGGFAEALKNIRLGTGVQHAVWLIILVLMLAK